MQTSTGTFIGNNKLEIHNIDQNIYRYLFKKNPSLIGKRHLILMESESVWSDRDIPTKSEMKIFPTGFQPKRLTIPQNIRHQHPNLWLCDSLCWKCIKKWVYSGLVMNDSISCRNVCPSGAEPSFSHDPYISWLTFADFFLYTVIDSFLYRLSFGR